MKKLRVLQRRQIFDFIHKKMVQTFEKFFMKESFMRIKTESLNKMEDIAFFITCNQGCSITSQSTEFDSPGRSKNSKRFRKTKNKNHYDMQGHRFQKHFVPNKNETLGSPNKSNRSSRSSLKSVDSERKAETLNIKPCKLNFSKKSLGAKVIGDISETANPEDELSSERSAAKEKSRVVYMDSPGRLSIVSSNSKPKFDPEQRLKTALR